MEMEEKLILRSRFYGGTTLAARDDFMREHAIVRMRLLQGYFRAVPPGSARTKP